MIPLMKNAFLHEYETKEALADFIRQAPRLSMDAECRKFERAFALEQKRKHALLVNSGSSANLLVILALKNLGLLRDGDAVGFSAVTWSTNVMPILQLGMRPVAVDCDPAYLNVTSRTLRERHEKFPIKALFLTNALGFTGDLIEIRDFCAEKGILLLEDNCESLGTELSGTKTGNFGLAATFSFFVAHHMSTIEGGMVVTDDDDLAEMLTIARANGWDRNLPAEKQHRWRTRHGIRNEFEAKYTFYDLAFNVRPTEITGFIGQRQHAYLRENVSARQSIWKRLSTVMKKNADLVVTKDDHLDVVSAFSLPVVSRTSDLREHYVRQFAGAGVEIRPMIAGNMQRQPFWKKYVNVDYACPGADSLHDCAFYAGLYPELTENDLEIICSCLTRYG